MEKGNSDDANGAGEKEQRSTTILQEEQDEEEKEKQSSLNISPRGTEKLRRSDHYPSAEMDRQSKGILEGDFPGVAAPQSMVIQNENDTTSVASSAPCPGDAYVPEEAREATKSTLHASLSATGDGAAKQKKALLLEFLPQKKGDNEVEDVVPEPVSSASRLAKSGKQHSQRLSFLGPEGKLPLFDGTDHSGSVEEETSGDQADECRTPPGELRNIRENMGVSTTSLVGAFEANPGSGILHALNPARITNHQRIVAAGQFEIATTSHRGPALDDESRLAVARPVAAESSSQLDNIAEEVDLEQQEQNRRLKTSRQKQQQRRWVFFFVCCLLLLLVGLIFGIILRRDDPIVEVATAAPSSSSAPSSIPSNPPTPSPTQDPLAKLKTSLPGYTLSSIENKLSPQSKAFDWLSNHTRLDEFEEWRRVQLFALATFFFSMGGPDWPKDVGDHWIQYDVSECNWHSGFFGEFDTHGGYQQVANVYEDIHRTSPCNETGVFESFFIEGFDISHLNPIIPFEIELLTSLNEIGFTALGISGSLNDWLPTILFNMSSIESIWLYNNSFTGTIPSELFRMTQLKKLSLHNNSLSGEMPTEIGSLSSLERLSLGQNPSFTASQIPSEIWSLTNLWHLDLELTNRTGTLASEIRKLSNLRYLYLESNELTGGLPQISSSHLKELWLQDNGFNGT